MLFTLLAQANAVPIKIAPENKALISLYLMIALLGVGILMIIGLVIAWRNHIQRQREIEQDREERDADLPRADAWATAAQRIHADDTGPDEAHVTPYPDDEYQPGPSREDQLDEEDDEDDEDDFPFTDDDGDDDEGPIGRS